MAFPLPLGCGVFRCGAQPRPKTAGAQPRSGCAGAMPPPILIEAPWREPVEVLAAVADEPWTIGFVSGGERARWSYLAADPDATLSLAADDPRDPFAALAALAGPTGANHPDGPPFQGGVVGLAAYELGDRVERLGLPRIEDWPDLACARYGALLAFDHHGAAVLADRPRRDRRPQARPAPALRLAGRRPPRPAPAPLADALQRQRRRRPTRPPSPRWSAASRAGEIFQANIARAWTGRLAPGAQPVRPVRPACRRQPGALRGLSAAARPGAGLQLARAVPRRCAEAGGAVAETRPIKGTRPRGADPAEDAALAAELLGQRQGPGREPDDRRPDAQRPGPGLRARQRCAVPELFARRELRQRPSPGLDGDRAAGAGPRPRVDLLRAAFPPGSITGAPKVQAMKVIAGLEPPRGPLLRLAVLGRASTARFDSSVLIRTAGLRRGRRRLALRGAGRRRHRRRQRSARRAAGDRSQDFGAPGRARVLISRFTALPGRADSEPSHQKSTLENPDLRLRWRTAPRSVRAAGSSAPCPWRCAAARRRRRSAWAP